MKRWAGHNFRRKLLHAGAPVAIFFLVLVITYPLAEGAFDVVRSVTGVGQRRPARGLVSLLSLSLGLVAAFCSGWLAHVLLTRTDVEDATIYCGNCGYNLLGNISGQCPECGMNDVRHFLRCMQQKEDLTRVGVFLMFAGGTPLSFLGPAVLATMFWLAAFLFRLDVSWISIFAVLAVVTVPLLYRTELRTSGEYFNQVMQETEVYGPTGIALRLGPAGQVGAIGVIAANPRATSSLFVEFFLLGPRLVVGALQKLKTARLLKPVSRERAAAILGVLMSEGKGVDSARLLDEGEALDTIIPTLAYLAAYGWIGVRDGWRHVWLLSEARRRLTGSAQLGAS